MSARLNQLLLTAALPALTLAALLPYVFAAPPQWGCGEGEPLGQDQAVEHFRAIALPVIAASATALMVVIVLARRRGPRGWLSMTIGFAVLAAALATPIGRAYFGLAGALAVSWWPGGLAISLLLAAFLLVLVAQAARDPSPREWDDWYSAYEAVAWIALLPVLAIFVFAFLDDGGPIYC
jgi:hypothetical protein